MTKSDFSVRYELRRNIWVSKIIYCKRRVSTFNKY